MSPLGRPIRCVPIWECQNIHHIAHGPDLLFGRLGRSTSRSSPGTTLRSRRHPCERHLFSGVAEGCPSSGPGQRRLFESVEARRPPCQAMSRGLSPMLAAPRSPEKNCHRVSCLSAQSRTSLDSTRVEKSAARGLAAADRTSTVRRGFRTGTNAAAKAGNIHIWAREPWDIDTGARPDGARRRLMRQRWKNNRAKPVVLPLRVGSTGAADSAAPGCRSRAGHVVSRVSVRPTPPRGERQQRFSPCMWSRLLQALAVAPAAG
ncbi:hypothetical protein M432DRAFT_247752 [Thermoascus aurantiacus ATCC 26904]